MRKLSVIALVFVLSGLVLWYAKVNQRGTHTDEPSIAGNLVIDIGGVSGRTITGNLRIDGASSAADRIAMLQGALAVEGNLHTRSLPNGELGLEGDLHVRPATP